ncbi:hypothetical protein AN958_02187 [Leucoagaricus sp. SymC.cos]|nr:hypothetical protein AN958_02187 [Leucoagaricus sp. SymC.cos]
MHVNLSPISYQVPASYILSTSPTLSASIPDRYPFVMNPRSGELPTPVALQLYSYRAVSCPAEHTLRAFRRSLFSTATALEEQQSITPSRACAPHLFKHEVISTPVECDCTMDSSPQVTFPCTLTQRTLQRRSGIINCTMLFSPINKKQQSGCLKTRSLPGVDLAIGSLIFLGAMVWLLQLVEGEVGCRPSCSAYRDSLIHPSLPLHVA